jgi:hypothetical protein
MIPLLTLYFVSLLETEPLHAKCVRWFVPVSATTRERYQNLLPRTIALQVHPNAISHLPKYAQVGSTLRLVA